MTRRLGALARILFTRLPAEAAHRATIMALRLAPAPAPRRVDPRLAVRAFGLEFPNPLGMAAGFDKDAEVPRAVLGLGFGFAEVGTMTPRPQPGNPQPRLFRLPADRALVNRFGFNNRGYEAARARLAAHPIEGVVGVNIGPNKDAADRLADYTLGVKTFAPYASYFTINISSPNTPGLRDLQRREALDELVARVVDAREEAPVRRPVLVKIAPDLDLRGLDDVVAVCATRGVDGMIVSNTTIARPLTLRGAKAREAGGLSGRPLFEPSTRMLARTYLRCAGAFPLIGCGGVDDGPSAVSKIEAGATLVQLYTGLVYCGPSLIDEVLDGIANAVTARGVEGIAGLVGRSARDWALAG